MNASNTLTISEILELRNELSSAAAKFTTSCIETEEGGLTFFDVAEKITMLQSSSIYAKEIEDNINQLKESIDEPNILEIIGMILEILHFITENSVQLEEQMTTTLKNTMEYCASPSENVDSDLILQQLEIMKQLLEQKRQDLEEIQQEAERKKRAEIDAKRRQAENDYINQMRCVAHQYGNMSIDICTSSGRREHIQSGNIPSQARPVSHQQFQIRGNSVQDVTQQLKNILDRYR